MSMWPDYPDGVSLRDVGRSAASRWALMDPRRGTFLPQEWAPEPHQVTPGGNWLGWLMLAGRGAGKTDACAAHVKRHVNGPPCIPGRQPHRIGIVAPTQGDAVDACVTGPSGIQAHDAAAKFLPAAPGGSIVRWPNGSEARLFGAREPEDVERLRAGGNRCIRMNTLVRTARGEVPIQDVTTNDLVWTRRGLRRVLHVWNNGVRPLWRLETEGGRALEATGDHKVWTEERGWSKLTDLRPGDTLTAWDNQRQSSTTVSRLSGCRKATTRHRGDRTYIGTYGSSIEDRFHLSTTCITCSRMTTQRPMSNDSSYFLTDRTSAVITEESSDPSVSSCVSAARSRLQHVERTHDSVSRVDDYESSEVRYPAPLMNDEHASSAARSTRRAIDVILRPAPDHVRSRSDTQHEVIAFQDDSFRNVCASYAEPGLRWKRNDRPRPARDRVASCSPMRREGIVLDKVFDLTIEDAHEFWGGDILLHNCLVWMEELAAWRYLQQVF